MLKKFGYLLHKISLVWLVFALLRTFVGLVGITSNRDVIRGLIGVAMAAVAYFLGKWLQTFNLTENLEKSKAAWWQADHKFRLVAFSSGSWILGAIFIQDGYYYHWDFILYPPLALLALYLGYMKLVVGTPVVSSRVPEDLEVQELDPQKKEFVQPSQSDVELPQNGKDRERAMDELIRRMGTKANIK